MNTGFAASGVDFDQSGSDEGDPVQDIGWADLYDDGRLDGEIACDNGDEATFIGAR